MPLPHPSVDRLHEAIVEACMAYERSCRRRGVKLEKVTAVYEPNGAGFDIKFSEHPYPHTKGGNHIIPVEEQEVEGEDVPIPHVKGE